MDLPELKTFDSNGYLNAFRTGENDGRERADRAATLQIGQAAKTGGYLDAAKMAMSVGKIDLAAKLEQLSADKQARFYDAMGRAASGADTPEKWAAMTQRMSQMYGPESVKGFESFGSRQQAIDISMTALQQAQLKIQQQEAARAAGADARSAELHKYQVAQLYNTLQKPDDTATMMQMFGLPAPAPSARIVPPRPPWAGPTPAAVPTPAVSPAAPSAAPIPTMTPSMTVGGTPSFPGLSVATPPVATPSPTPTTLPAPVAPPAPAPTMPTPAASSNPWAADPAKAALAFGVATGRISDKAGAMIASGPNWIGVPDSIRVKAWEESHKANVAANTHLETMATLDKMQELLPEAYVGAGANIRTTLAAHLSALGADPKWLIDRKSLPATQLLQQYAENFIGTIADKFKPISNSDIHIIRAMLPNIGQNPKALEASIGAMKRIAQRQALFEAAHARALQQSPNPDLNAIYHAVMKEVPDVPFDFKKTGKGDAPPPSAATGSRPPGVYDWTPDGGVVRSSGAPSESVNIDTTPEWWKY